MTRFPLRRLRLRPGDEHRDAIAVELEPFELGGQRYLPVPHAVQADLTIAQATTGLDLRLAFDVRLHGPCMRCLADAVVDVRVDAREYHANDPSDADELRTERQVDVVEDGAGAEEADDAVERDTHETSAGRGTRTGRRRAPEETSGLV